MTGSRSTMVAMIFAVTLAAVPALAVEPGRCLTVRVPSPVVLPDGDVRGPGALRLCERRGYSPVASVHEVFLDGTPVGMHVSRKGRSEGPASSDPYVQFRRDVSGDWVLLGYAWPDGQRMTTFVLNDTPPADTRVRGAGREPGEGIVLVAARAK